MMAGTAFGVVLDLLQLLRASVHSHARLAAENLFLRKQLALYVERKGTPRRANNATRATLVMLSRFIDWRPLLTVVQPDTLVRWHRHVFRLFWHIGRLAVGVDREFRWTSSS